jgi:hypothetical protein
MARRLASLLTLSALALGGCYDQGQGADPPLDRIYFPVALAVSPGATRLYVINSDFDLQYNGGAVQSLDLSRLRGVLPTFCLGDADCTNGKHCDLSPTDANDGYPSHWCVADDGKPCGDRGEQSAATRKTVPGRCGPVRLADPQDGQGSLIVGKVGIGAFGTDVIYRPRPSGPGGRLFVPVRGDATLHYIEVGDDTESPMPFELECGQANNGGKCDDQHRVGNDPEAENTRDLRLASEPYGIAASADGEAIVLTHQTQGAASLLVNDAPSWGDGGGNLGLGPTLEFTVGGMPSRPIGVAAIPVPGLVKEKGLPYAPGFLVTFRDAAQIDLLRYFADPNDPARPFIQVAGAAGITANSLNFDSRGIALDPSERDACEAKCAAGPDDLRLGCFSDCTGVPVQVYVANRTPSSLLVGEMRPNQNATASDDLPRFTDSIPLAFGPSHVTVGKIIGPDGELHTRVFAVCFDSQKIGAFDPVSRIVEWFDTGRGPHAFAVDVGHVGGSPSAPPTYAYGYVGHFTDSYLGVIDLDQRHGNQYGTIVASIGRPSQPRASK